MPENEPREVSKQRRVEQGDEPMEGEEDDELPAQECVSLFSLFLSHHPPFFFLEFSWPGKDLYNAMKVCLGGIKQSEHIHKHPAKPSEDGRAKRWGRRGPDLG